MSVREESCRVLRQHKSRAEVRSVGRFGTGHSLLCGCVLASLLMASMFATISIATTEMTAVGASGPTLPTTYSYTDSTVTWGPWSSDETIEILAVGAAGGSDLFADNSSTGGEMLGGDGAAEMATLTVPTGDSLTIAAGGAGGNALSNGVGAAGYNGGAAGRGGNLGTPGGGGGGGASSVTESGTGGSTALVVASGGGGAGGSDCSNHGLYCSTYYGDEFPQQGGAGGAGGISAGVPGGAGQSGSEPGGGGGGGGVTSGTSGSGGAGGSGDGNCSGDPGGAGAGGPGEGPCYDWAGVGGGGGGGYYGGGGGGGGGGNGNPGGAGGGGGGGSSYVVAGATSLQSEAGTNAGAGYVEIGSPGSLSLPLVGGAVTAANGQGGGPTTWCGCVGATPTVDPVNAIDGDFYQSATDLTVPGPGVPLGFVRTYDANMAQISGGVSNPSDLGPGWTDNLAMNIASVPGMATVTEADGAEVQFTPSNTNTAWCQSADNYCPLAPRDISTLNQNTDGTWTFTDDLSSPLTYTFTSSGQLSKIANAAGQSITASTESPGGGTGSAACPSSATSCTVWTSSVTNETLTEVYDAGVLTEVQGYASSGSPASVSFCYYGSTCAAGHGSGLAGSLYSATDPGARTTSYAYDYANSNTALRYDLVTQTNPDQSTIANQYNSAGEVSQQTSPSGVVSTFSYNEIGTPSQPVGAVPGDSTTVTVSPGGGQPSTSTQYTFSSGELASTTVDPGGATQSVTSTLNDPDTGQHASSTDNGNTSTTNLPTPSTPSSYLNAIDPTSTTDALGNTSLYGYTSTNQIWCEVEPAEAANGVVCPSSQLTTPPSPGSSGKPTSNCTAASTQPCLGATFTFYDAAGNPTYVTDPLGNTTQTKYTTAEQPWCQVDAAEYTSAGTSCPSSPPASPPTGTVTGYTTTLYDSSDRETSVTNPLGATTTYGYHDTTYPDSATKVVDPEGDTTLIYHNDADQPTRQVETAPAGAFSATTITAYDAAGRVFCTMSPLGYAEENDTDTCPSTEPTSPPSPSSDTNPGPYPGAQVTIYNGSGQPTYQINAVGGVTQTAYDGAGNVYCTVAPADYAQSISCPAVGAAWTAGITLTSYDANGRAVSVTNPLGGVTATTYDASSNVTQTTIESNNSSADPNIVTSYGYDADNRLTSTTVDPGGGTLQQETKQSYDPDSNVFCSVSANAVAGASFQCPTWQDTWIAAPPSPTSLYSSTPTAAQANDVTTTFYDADNNQVQSTNPDVETTVDVNDPDGRTICQSDPTNVAAWLKTNPTGTYPYLCTSPPPSSGVTATVYDQIGDVTSSTDQVGDVTKYTYTPDGSVQTMEDPGSNTTTDCYYYESGTSPCSTAAPSAGGLGSDLYQSTTPDTAKDASGEVTTTTYFPGGRARCHHGRVCDDAGGHHHRRLRPGRGPDLGPVPQHRQRLRRALGPRLHLQPGRHPGHHDRRLGHDQVRLRRQRRRDLHPAGGERGPLEPDDELRLLQHRRPGLGQLPGLWDVLGADGELHLRRHRGHGHRDRLAGQRGHLLPRR